MYKGASLAKVESETTGPTSQCGRQSSWLISSANHLVRQEEKCRGNRETESLGRLEVNHQLELCWLLDRQVGGLYAFQNLVHIGGGVVKVRRYAWPVRHEAAHLRKYLLGEDPWKPRL